KRLSDETGTRLLDWVDHLGLPDSPANRAQLSELGFASADNSGHAAWRHAAGLFPEIHLYRQAKLGLAVQVESVVDFLTAHRLEEIEIDGEPLANLRKARLSASDKAEFWVLERHGTRSWQSSPLTDKQLRAVLVHGEAFRRRQRHFDQPEAAFEHTSRLVAAAAADLGVHRACDLFFAAEREYWQRRNRAGQIQHARQQALGLGWANHDHHTYRSSRRHFVR